MNRKDAGGHNVFEGGFLGLDNIGVFNRSEPLPTGGTLRQADGTAWMAFYCLNMCVMLELWIIEASPHIFVGSTLPWSLLNTTQYTKTSRPSSSSILSSLQML